MRRNATAVALVSVGTLAMGIAIGCTSGPQLASEPLAAAAPARVARVAAGVEPLSPSEVTFALAKEQPSPTTPASAPALWETACTEGNCPTAASLSGAPTAASEASSVLLEPPLRSAAIPAESEPSIYGATMGRLSPAFRAPARLPMTSSSGNPGGIASYDDPIGVQLTRSYEDPIGVDRRPVYTQGIGAQP